MFCACLLCLFAMNPAPATPSAESIVLEALEPNGQIVIGHDHAGLEGNKHGFEGGCAVRTEDACHLFLAEMSGDPFWVTMRLGHWKSADMKTWQRVGTLFESKGKGFENDPKYSIWSPMPIYDEIDARWNLFYVCYRGALSPKEGTHMDGKIYRAVSKTPGRAGLAGPYEDAGVLMQPDAESMAWEGQQGVDSFYPYQAGGRWYSHYGSHNYDPVSPWLVGLASAPALSGPWKRIPAHSPLTFEKEFVENPIVSRVGPYYVAVYDSSPVAPGNKYIEEGIHVGYSFSRDGIGWAPGKRLAIHTEGDANWAADIRTPLGLIPLDEGRFAMFYTARDKSVQFWNVGLAIVRVSEK